MKKFVAMMLAVLAANSAFAGIAVNWRALTGFYDADVVGVPTDPDDYINFGGGSALAYLVYSPSGTLTLDLNNLAGGLVGGDNVLVLIAGNPVTEATGSPYGNFTYANQAEIVGAYGSASAQVWSRVIDLSAPAGYLFQYFDSPTVAAPLYNVNQPALIDLVGQSGSEGAIGDQMIGVVPEPSVLAFLAIGGIALAVRRRIVA
jgi:hypothetical protein